MPDREVHCQHTFQRYGVRGDDIHIWIDEPVTIAGPHHRQYRHDIESLSIAIEVFKGKYNSEIIKNIFLDHLTLDKASNSKGYWNKKVTNTCKWCGKEFTVDECHRVFCSQECHAEWTKKTMTITVTKICKNCKKEFQDRRSGNKRFCSEECKIEWHKLQKTLRESGESLWNRRKNWNHRCNLHKCSICEKIFIPNKPYRKYCSKECEEVAHRSNMSKAICKRCGKEFYHRHKSGRHPIYCSQECHGLDMRENGKNQVDENGTSRAFALFIISLRETDPESYYQLHKKLIHEMGPEWRMAFDRKLGKFQIKIRGKTFRSGEIRETDGSKFKFKKPKQLTALAIPQTTALATRHP